MISLLDSLEDDDLSVLRDYEQGTRARPRVLSAIERVVASRGGG